MPRDTEIIKLQEQIRLLKLENAELEKNKAVVQDRGARLFAIVESAIDGIITIDEDGIIESCNPAAERMFSYECTDIIGKNISMLMADSLKGRQEHDIKKKFFETGNDKIIATGREILARKKDGTVFPVEIAVTEMFIREKRLLTGTIRDITERKKAIQALQNAHDKLETRVSQRTFELESVNKQLIQKMEEMAFAQEQIQILAKFPDENPNPVLRVDREGVILYSNAASCRFLKIWNKQIGDKLPSWWNNTRVKHLEGNAYEDFEVSIEGRVYLFNAAAIPDLDMFYLYARDITDNKEFEEQLLLFAGVFENCQEGIMIIDSAGKIVRVNPAFHKITGYSPGEAINNSPEFLCAGKQNDDFQLMWKSVNDNGQWMGEVWSRRKNGDAYPQWFSITAIEDQDSKVTYYIAVFHDITFLKQSEDKFRYQAYHDALTCLPNRLLFLDRLEQAIAQAQRNNEKIGVMFLDLDKFKMINDTLGHDIGDLLLQEVAVRLGKNSRQGDTVARLGGDEFVAILPNIKGVDDTIDVAARILKSIDKFNLDENEIKTSTSIGISIYPDHGGDVESLVRNADRAMYQAKKSGKGIYKIYSPGTQDGKN
jgi:diguanylate cyclase (GGDEF)-like protein/PAS domain S-box-containing protein